MKAYKVFNPDWTCQGFQYKVGETYKMEGAPILCERGFHACPKLQDCFNYYSFDPENKVAVVELWGFIKGHTGDKIVGTRITVISELNWHEVLELSNLGNRNSGNGNSGNGNSGDWNSGNGNSGDWNSGDWNSGNGNSGDWNSGDWNSGNGNSGFFNTNEPFVRMFNKKTRLKIGEIYFPECLYFKINENETFKDAAKRSIKNATDHEKQAIRKLPNYNADIFEEIFGIRV